MPVPQVYGAVAEQAIASYDYFDISEGTGIQVFYLQVVTGVSAEQYLIMKNPLWQFGATTSGVTTTGSHTFSLAPFNAPKIVKGTAYISLNVRKVPAGNDNMTFNLQKNGVTIATVTKVLPSDAGYILGLPVTIPQTKFSVGDVLGLDIVCANASTKYGIDPFNRDDTTISGWFAPSSQPEQTTQFKLYIPFRLDL